MPECEGAGFKCAVCRQAHIHTRTPTVRWWCCSSVAVCDRARRQTGIERSWTHTIPASLPWQLRPQPGPDRWAEQRTEPKECVCPLTRCSKVISRGHWRRRCCCQVYTQNWPSVAHTEVLTWMNKWMKWGRTPAVGDAQTFFSSYRIGRNGEGNIVEPSPHRETHSSDLAFVEHFWFFGCESSASVQTQKPSDKPEGLNTQETHFTQIGEWSVFFSHLLLALWKCLFGLHMNVTWAAEQTAATVFTGGLMSAGRTKWRKTVLFSAADPGQVSACFSSQLQFSLTLKCIIAVILLYYVIFLNIKYILKSAMLHVVLLGLHLPVVMIWSYFNLFFLNHWVQISSSCLSWVMASITNSLPSRINQVFPILILIIKYSFTVNAPMIACPYHDWFPDLHPLCHQISVSCCLSS